MQLSIDSKALSEALATLKAPKRPSRPIYATTQLIASQGTLTLVQATDERGIKLVIDADVEVEGCVILHSETLKDAVASCGKSLSIAVEDNAVVLKSEGRRFSLPIAAEPEDFPEFPGLTDGKVTTFAIETDLLLNAIVQTQHAISTDETKQVLTGLHLALNKDDMLAVAATDGHRLAAIKVDAPEAAKALESGIVIPGSTIAILKTLLIGAETEVSYDSFLARFTCGGNTMVARLIEGQYPNYPQLIPTKFAWDLKCDRDEILGAIASVAFVAIKKNNIIKLSSDGMLLGISAEAVEFGKAGATVAAAISGEFPVAMACDLRYLGEALKALPKGEVVIEGNGAKQPFILSAEGAGLHLVMPVQIRS